MKKRPSRHIIAFVSLLVFLLSGQAGVQGYVWCLGEDGHAALEYPANAACGQGAEHQGRDCGAEETVNLPPLKEHCGSCLDIPTSADATSRRLQENEELPVHVRFPAAFEASLLPGCVRELEGNLNLQPPPRISQAILSLRTVVLLN